MSDDTAAAASGTAATDAGEPAAARPARLRVGATAAAGSALAIAAVAFATAAGARWRIFVDSYTLTNLVIGLGFLAAGTPIVWFRRRNVIGPLFLVCGIGHLTTAAATTAMLFGLGMDWPVPLLRTLSTLSTGAWQLGIGWLFNVALLVFPNGRLLSRRWLPLAWLVMVCGAYQLVTGVLSDGSVLGDSARTVSIVSVGLDVPESISSAVGGAGAVAQLLVVASLVLRYRRGDERTRRQLLWLILALVAALALNSQRWITGDGPILLLLSFALFPIAIGIAIVRYELFDIRLVLSRALLYGLTLSMIIAVYAGLVAGFSLLVPKDAERGVSIGAAIVVAICFTPLRLLLRRLIDRAFYGTRSDPAQTAWRVGEGLRHDDDLAGVLDRTRVALRLPWVALRREPGGAELATTGTPQDSATVELPLGYRGDVVGTLAVGLRRGEPHLHEADRRTLELIATPLAVALHATRLSEQVQQARTATVEAAAAERVRLQRELHDGLGPTLSSITFLADAASNLIGSDSGEAERLLGEVRADLRAALDSVRRVVYGLRPIELDDLGLVGALSQKVAGLSGETRRGIAVELDAPVRIPTLSPAVELAAYRIVNEALTNVLRHSDARRCVITVSVDGDLLVTVRDDGTPPASWRPGVGLRSISERAEELAGSATAGPSSGGWEVRARLPLPLDRS
ncbi:GAF domain-containing sensor histidine kinase [Microtetraspora fusca]|uniref:GAF domain-containing sensor histidine kinase n=1 Tax=Microtetraspora fusca TaxID=1997 RepID=UPI000A060E03|nr:GAF domain-containing sensor histidine kinase [Microtetraspora fusca]